MIYVPVRVELLERHKALGALSGEKDVESSSVNHNALLREDSYKLAREKGDKEF